MFTWISLFQGFDFPGLLKKAEEILNYAPYEEIKLLPVTTYLSISESFTPPVKLEKSYPAKDNLLPVTRDGICEKTEKKLHGTLYFNLNCITCDDLVVIIHFNYGIRITKRYYTSLFFSNHKMFQFDFFRTVGSRRVLIKSVEMVDIKQETFWINVNDNDWSKNLPVLSFGVGNSAFESSPIFQEDMRLSQGKWRTNLPHCIKFAIHDERYELIDKDINLDSWIPLHENEDYPELKAALFYFVYDEVWKANTETNMTVATNGSTASANQLDNKSVLPSDSDSTVIGQGTALFRIKPYRSFAIVFFDQTQSVSTPALFPSIRANIDHNSVEISVGSIKSKQTFSSVQKGRFFERGKETAFWLSVDKINRRIRFGLGEMRLELMRMEHIVESAYDFNPLNSVAVMDIQSGLYIHTLSALIWPVAVTVSIPIKVKSNADITLEDLALNSYYPSSNLDPDTKILYESISSSSINLEPDEFRKFSRAIHKSVVTPGSWCYNKLREKAEASNVPLKFTYLRIPIMGNENNSPGQPFVLEIWPFGHTSRIHNHGMANAVIKVLYGSIQVDLFPDITLPDEYLTSELEKNEITFLTPQFYQIHRLRNESPDNLTAITLQSYRYKENDDIHYEYFDWVDDTGKIHSFNPNADSYYRDFKEIIRQEWSRK
eukprot:gene9291-12519_t